MNLPWKSTGKTVINKTPEEWMAEGADSGKCPDCGGVLRNFAGDRCNHCGRKRPPITPKFHAGDPCPNVASGCDGRLGIRTTNLDTDNDGIRTRYFKCSKCGADCSCDVDAAAVRSRRKL